jgi:hypothetical protein
MVYGARMVARASVFLAGTSLFDTLCAGNGIAVVSRAAPVIR